VASSSLLAFFGTGSLLLAAKAALLAVWLGEELGLTADEVSDVSVSRPVLAAGSNPS
jgi:hypothetical protein